MSIATRSTFCDSLLEIVLERWCPEERFHPQESGGSILLMGFDSVEGKGVNQPFNTCVAIVPEPSVHGSCNRESDALHTQMLAEITSCDVGAIPSSRVNRGLVISELMATEAAVGVASNTRVCSQANAFMDRAMGRFYRGGDPGCPASEARDVVAEPDWPAMLGLMDAEPMFEQETDGFAGGTEREVAVSGHG